MLQNIRSTKKWPKLIVIEQKNTWITLREYKLKWKLLINRYFGVLSDKPLEF